MFQGEPFCRRAVLPVAVLTRILTVHHPIQNSSGYVRVLDSTIILYMSASFVSNLSNPKPGHTTSGSGRGARRSRRAGSGKIGCQQNYSPRKQRSTVPSKASKKRRFNVSPEARTNEILCKPNTATKPAVNMRLITGLSAGREALFVPGCRPVE